MSILKRHSKKYILWEKGDLKLFNPSENKLNEIQSIISDNVSINVDDGTAKGNLGLNIIRYLLREVTSIGAEVDEYDDGELVKLLDNGDRDLNKLLKEINLLINDITEDVIDTHLEQIKLTNSMFKILELNLSTEESKKRLDKVLKKQGLNITAEEMTLYKDDPEKIKELISSSKKRNTRKK